ncbi:hypothetical protein BDN71DRAFT_1450584 [Pleurotus eryngii]|uniref:Uncharacterized protein n=1 Tax=Pleurotus eryngii TaxID=5323 RepID=A0A9P6DDR8_PLEER|nr:hypothetical protein BDN71DRAFT_1450584 [Pleurotus eryngii]
MFKVLCSDALQPPPRSQSRGALTCHPSRSMSISLCEVLFPPVDSTVPGELPTTPELVTAF